MKTAHKFISVGGKMQMVPTTEHGESKVIRHSLQMFQAEQATGDFCPVLFLVK